MHKRYFPTRLTFALCNALSAPMIATDMSPLGFARRRAGQYVR